jgi:hypothetical protein
MNELNKIINPEFTFQYNGKDYQIRKASLRKVIQYQEKVRELSEKKDPGVDYKLLAYCIFLILKGVEPSLTEDGVLDTVPGDINVIETLALLGFMTPSQKELALKAQKIVTDKLNMLSSSSH